MSAKIPKTPKAPKVHKTSEQISNDIDAMQKTVSHHMGILVALIPQDHSVVVGTQTTTRTQIRDNAKNLDKAFKAIKSQVRKGVRKSKASAAEAHEEGEEGEASTDVPAKKRNGGLDKPNFYQPELIKMFLNSNMGNVDPLNPKSEKLTDVLKRSLFGTKYIASAHTFSRLFSIMARANDYKDPNPGCGHNIKFPPGFLQKNIPQIYSALDETGFDLENVTYISSDIRLAGVVPKSVLDEAQTEELLKGAEAAKEVEELVKQTLLRYKFKESAPVPVIPASLAVAKKASPTKKATK